mmetsp:Transcript_40518/g.35958  ORF Transcript_40518/g.35958 Transcript_40518/m.35958 type:complete len:100 (-) Transcript_40518:971-1270(-)
MREMETQRKGSKDLSAIVKILKKVNPQAIARAKRRIKFESLLKCKKSIGKMLMAPFVIITPDDSFAVLWIILAMILTITDLLFGPYWVSFFNTSEDVTD